MDAPTGWDHAKDPFLKITHRMKTITLVAAITVALACASFAQAPADTSPEKAGVLANDRAYEAAYAKSDAKALADFFAEDADYTTEDGRLSADARPSKLRSAPGSRPTGARSSPSPRIPCACSGRRRCWKKARPR